MNKYEHMTRSSHLLLTFVTIAECQNITRAADLLGRTQSAISVQVKKLEEILEVALFARQSKGMLLTAEGEKLLPVARRILDELTRVGALFEKTLQGCIRIGIPDDYAESVLETVLVEFAIRHPEVEVSARFGCTSKFPDAIKTNSLDVAVVSGVHEKITDQISSEPNVWVASPDLNHQPDAPVPLAILDRECGWRDFGSSALDAAGRDWRVAYASENFSGVKAAVRSGLAVSALPRSLKEPSMVELGRSEGFPSLPSTERGLLVSENADAEIVQAMIGAIKSAT